MTTWKYRNGYVEIYEDGIFVGNYDTIAEYQEEKRKKEQEEMFALARRMEAEPHHEENEMEELPEDSMGADEVQSEINEEDDRKDETEI